MVVMDLCIFQLWNMDLHAEYHSSSAHHSKVCVSEALLILYIIPDFVHLSIYGTVYVLYQMAEISKTRFGKKRAKNSPWIR